jgi:N-acetylglucosaminyl-diphospho-decaprenol L-rhamnosyltransferase
MKICAVILDYRGAEKTGKCLLSLVGQGIDTVLIVDNSADRRAGAALDNTVQDLRRSAPGYELPVLRPAVNLGFARGVNLALGHHAALACDAFLLLNNDATAMPHMVSRLVDTLVERDADLVAPAIVDAGGRRQPMLWYQRFFGLLTAGPLPASFPYLSGCCLLFRRELLASDKLFDDDFFMYGEDTLLGWQMARAGKILTCNEDAVVCHAGRGSSRQSRLFYEYHMARAHVLLALKTARSPAEIPFLLIAKSIGLALRAVRRCARSGSAVPLLAFFLAWLPLEIRAR